jgi:hypothetical protein
MPHSCSQRVRNGASLLFLPPAAHAQQRMLEPSEYLKDPQFKSLYVKALGPKSKTPWRRNWPRYGRRSGARNRNDGAARSYRVGNPAKGLADFFCP